MSSTIDKRLSDRESFGGICRLALKRIILPFGVLAPFAYFHPGIALFYATCGVYDVSRNRGLTLSTLRRYFMGNGVLVWALSPINILLDLFSLPYLNKGVYRLEDLQEAHQAEVRRLIAATREVDLVGEVEGRSKQHRRAMIFWRSYGVKYDTIVNVPAFHEPWSYIQTIGLSVFNKGVTTSPHFGWLRATLRVLYNINDVSDRSAYIQVGDQINYWCENKLFIFDDTLLHVSANGDNQLRYCMFVDILRPSPFPGIMAAVSALEGYLNKKFQLIRLSGWTLVQR